MKGDLKMTMNKKEGMEPVGTGGGFPTETRAQTITKLEFFTERMTDAQLRLLAAFASGIFKKG